MINDIKENDLLLVEKSFYYTPIKNDFKKVSYGNNKIIEGSILLVLENNFGSTFKDRFTICLLHNRKIFFNSSGFNSNINFEECLKLLNIKETND